MRHTFWKSTSLGTQYTPLYRYSGASHTSHCFIPFDHTLFHNKRILLVIHTKAPIVAGRVVITKVFHSLYCKCQQWISLCAKIPNTYFSILAQVKWISNCGICIKGLKHFLNFNRMRWVCHLHTVVHFKMVNNTLKWWCIQLPQLQCWLCFWALYIVTLKKRLLQVTSPNQGILDSRPIKHFTGHVTMTYEIKCNDFEMFHHHFEDLQINFRLNEVKTPSKSRTSGFPCGLTLYSPCIYYAKHKWYVVLYWEWNIYQVSFTEL